MTLPFGVPPLRGPGRPKGCLRFTPPMRVQIWRSKPPAYLVAADVSPLILNAALPTSKSSDDGKLRIKDRTSGRQNRLNRRRRHQESLMSPNLVPLPMPLPFGAPPLRGPGRPKGCLRFTPPMRVQIWRSKPPAYLVAADVSPLILNAALPTSKSSAIRQSKGGSP